MAPDQPPVGKLYAHIYMARGEPTEITPRLRVRLAGYHNGLLTASDARYIRNDFGRLLNQELGADFFSHGKTVYSSGIEEYFKNCTNLELLHTITLVWRFFRSMEYPDDRKRADDWVALVRRAFVEENVRYRVDDQGGVHPLVDLTFEQERVAAIQGLSGARYKGTLAAFEGAHEALERNPPDTKEAVRDVFSALENLVKLMTGNKAVRLGSAEVRQHLLPMVANRYSEPTAKRAADKVVAGLCDWIDSAHFYRHEPGTPEPAPPSVEYTVLMVSTGAGFLRWLAEIDRTINPKP